MFVCFCFCFPQPNNNQEKHWIASRILGGLLNRLGAQKVLETCTLPYETVAGRMHEAALLENPDYNLIVIGVKEW